MKTANHFFAITMKRFFFIFLFSKLFFLLNVFLSFKRFFSFKDKTEAEHVSHYRNPRADLVHELQSNCHTLLPIMYLNSFMPLRKL
jgi:hypothetical protein